MADHDYYGEEFPAEMGEEFPDEAGQEAAAAGPGSRGLVRRDPRIEDLQLAGPMTTIAAGESVEIPVDTKLPFRARHMTLGGSIAWTVGGQVKLNSIDIAAIEQIVSRDPIAGSALFTDGTNHLKGGIMVPGNGATVRFTNDDSEAIDIQPVFFGESVRPDVPESIAIQLLEQSQGYDLAAQRSGELDHLMAGTETITVPDDGPVTINFNPKVPFRPRRMAVIALGPTPGQAPYPAPVSNHIQLQSMQVGVIEQLISKGSDGIDAFSYQPQSRHHLKGSIVMPGTGMDITLAPLGDHAVGDETVQIVFWGATGKI